MNRPTCEATRKDGQGCRAPALPDSPLCWSHDPRQAEVAAAARAAGASKGGKLRAIEGRRKRLDSPRALALFMSNLVHDLVEGKVEADLVKVVAYAISVQCKVIDLVRQSDVEAMLAEVRQLTAEARMRARA